MVSFTRDIVVLDWLGARFASISNTIPRLCRDRQAEAKISKGRLGEGYFGERGEGGAALGLPATLPVSSFKSATNIKQFSHPWMFIRIFYLFLWSHFFVIHLKNKKVIILA